jgi:hypothetical protein
VFVTTLAPITLPCLEKICFKSVALVCEDNPDTHKLRLNVADSLPVSLIGEGAVIFCLPFAVVADGFVDAPSGIIVRNPNKNTNFLIIFLIELINFFFWFLDIKISGFCVCPICYLTAGRSTKSFK